MTTVSGSTFFALFQRFTSSARRLESRSHSSIEEEQPRFRAFLAGELPETCNRERTAWTEMVDHHTTRGRPFQRVRVMDEPLTDYNRYLLYRTPYNLAAGEDIRYLDRDRANALDLPDHDFWVFDSEIVCLLRFTADGRPLGHDVIADHGLAIRHEQWILRGWEAAVPYDEYVAADPTRVMPPFRARATKSR
ncbi:DUF6879 family protein [Pseudonocardia sichuanensis]